MAEIVREIPLGNGLTVRFSSHSRNYYGDFYLVKLEVHCEVPLRPDYFPDQAKFTEALALLGDVVVYRRMLEKMGVPASEIGTEEERLIANFKANSLAYFTAPSFPCRLVHAELAKVGRKKTPFATFPPVTHG